MDGDKNFKTLGFEIIDNMFNHWFSSTSTLVLGNICIWLQSFPRKPISHNYESRFIFVRSILFKEYKPTE